MPQKIKYKKPVYLNNADEHSDLYIGTKKPDLVYGLRGDDTLFGMDGDDLVKGGLGSDLIYGGRGRDRLLGEWGDDFLFGGTGNDVMTGGSGSDVFVFEPGGGIDRITDFQPGSDLIEFVGEGVREFALAMIDKIRLSTDQLHAVIEWSWQDQSNRIVLADVTVDFTATDFRNFSFSQAALAWFD